MVYRWSSVFVVFMLRHTLVLAGCLHHQNTYAQRCLKDRVAAIYRVSVDYTIRITLPAPCPKGVEFRGERGQIYISLTHVLIALFS